MYVCVCSLCVDYNYIYSKREIRFDLCFVYPPLSLHFVLFYWNNYFSSIRFFFFFYGFVRFCLNLKQQHFFFRVLLHVEVVIIILQLFEIGKMKGKQKKTLVIFIIRYLYVCLCFFCFALPFLFLFFFSNNVIIIDDVLLNNNCSSKCFWKIDVFDTMRFFG